MFYTKITVDVNFSCWEELVQMEPVVDFFRTLPAKVCTECNHPLEEQADCYPNICPECEGTAYYPSNYGVNDEEMK